MGIEPDEPLTPAGRLFVQPATELIINCALGIDRSVGIDVVRSVISNSLLVKHPRFTSLLVIDKHGRERWKRVDLEVDQHIVFIPDVIGDEGDDDEVVVNDYLANLSVSCPLSTDKPLWEIHVLSAHKCVVIRFHHALGDGISLLSLLLTLCRKVSNNDEMPTLDPPSVSLTNAGESLGIRLWKLLKMAWFTLVYMLAFCMRSLWLRDKKTVVSGGAGVELWPRKLATARFSLDDMKTVKGAVANAVRFNFHYLVVAIVPDSAAHRPHHRLNQGLRQPLVVSVSSGSCRADRWCCGSGGAPKEGLQITGAAMVNLRKSSGIQEITELMKKNSKSRWGNKFGMILLPIYYHASGSDPLHYIKRSKTMIDNKKLSLEALLSYKVGYFVMKCFGAKLASLLNYRIICNTSFTISNLVGPKEEFMIAGIPVTYIRATATSLAHAITMHMVSYAGKADMQILVAKEIIPHPEILAKFFEGALLDMKEAAKLSQNSA
ncbi:hypothetical protein E3N88_06190 [Mikania micrantha]|uniref:Uncharacterized protein n=1 Tax=Mikania micrantha TaxID=192012 RepID=A0A5N6PN11_9ASTR|nr:hypothetical protein E3N88_06190 [Mikania micrantha]